MRNDSISSNTIEWLRFFCAAGVVLLHVSESPTEGYSTIAYQNGIYDTVRILFSEGLCRTAVPIFFLFSGYLFFVNLDDWDTLKWLAKLKRRFHSLLIPYLLWSLIAIFYTFVMLYPKHLIKGGAIPDMADWFEIVGGFRAFWAEGPEMLPYNFPLWFIRNLIILVLLAPLVYQFVKKTKWIGLAVLFLVYVSGIGINVPGFETVGFFFFTLGAFFSINRTDFVIICKKNWMWASCVALVPLVVIVFTFGNNPEIWGYSHRLFTLFGSISLIGIAAVLLERGHIIVHSILSDSSFMIYAAHGTIGLPAMKFIMDRLFPSSSQAAMITKYFSAAVLTVIILVGCYWIMSRWFPRITSVLCGGRLQRHTESCESSTA